MTTQQVKMVDAPTAIGWLANERVVVIDVREPEEWTLRHIPGSNVNPLSNFDPTRIPKIDPGKKLLLHCQSAIRCGMAAQILVASGYSGEINRLAGGLTAWMAAGGPLAERE